ncbi:MAG: hypothetical protein A2Y81_09460 [Nitrospirae bacterium RBG_13_43_8]|nr:MAG: hypothetical protein A2Y81_09460 [Nitrospirae bacterium RBG_13_43_8]
MNISHLIILYEAAKCRVCPSGSCPRFVEDRSRIFLAISNKIVITIIINGQPDRIIVTSSARLGERVLQRGCLALPQRKRDFEQFQTYLTFSQKQTLLHKLKIMRVSSGN